MFLRLAGFILLALVAVSAHASETEQLWGALRAGGNVVLMRHAQTVSGFGDPPGFRVGDCATQRNLSADGREQARRLGAALKRSGVPIGEVLSSPWCRAVDTAKLAFGRAQVWPELSSMHYDRSREAAQNDAVRRRITAFRGPGNLFLVGHSANVISLTGVSLSSGGMVVVAPGGPDGFRVLGRLEPDQILSGQTGPR